MSLVLTDRVKETSITNGTGTITLTGSFGGFQSFLDGIGDGNTTYYVIENESKFEVGIGTYTESDNSLSRDTVLDSSNGGAKVDLSGLSIVFCTYPASKAVFLDENDELNIPITSLAIDSLNIDGLVTADSGNLGVSGLLTLRRDSAGNFFHAYVDNGQDKTISLYHDGSISPGWKLGLKNSPDNSGDPPTYAYVYAEDGSIGLYSNSLNSINLSHGGGFNVKNKGNTILTAYSSTGVQINSFSTANSVFTVKGAVAQAAPLQEWISSSNSSLARVESDGSIVANTIQSTGDLIASGNNVLTNISNLHTSGVSISGWARYYVDSQDHTSTALSGFLEPQITQNASDILFVSGLTNASIDALPHSSGDFILTEILANSASGAANAADLLVVSGIAGGVPAASGGLITQNTNLIHSSGNFLLDEIYASGAHVSGLASTAIAAVSGYNVGYTDVQIALLVDSAPDTLNTLNEIAAALNDDASIATTLTDSINNLGIFSRVSVAGQDHIDADSNSDSLTLAEGSNITITTSASTDTITISANDSGASEEDLIYVSGIAAYASGVGTYSSGILVDGGTLIPDADKGIAIAKGSENFPVTITQDDNFSGGAYYIRLRDNDTDNITLGATDVDAFQITASGEGSSGAENIFKFSSTANDDHLVFGGSAVPTKVLGSNVTVNAEGSVELQRGGSTRVRGDSAFTYLFGQTGGYIFYGANALKPQSATSIALGGASNYWGSLHSSNANLKGSTATNIPLTIDAQAAQSANLTEWKASDDVVIAQVAPDGSIATSGDISVSGTLIAGELKSPQDTGGYLRLRGSNDTYIDVSDGTMNFYCNTGQAFRLTSSFVDVFKTLRPISNQDLGRTTNRWPNLYAVNGDFSNTVSSSGVQASGLLLYDHAPTVTTNTLYNDGGTLMFNDSAVGGGSVSGTPSGVAFFGDDGSLTGDTDLITGFGTNGRRIGINSVANPTSQLTVGNQVYNQSAIAEIKNYSRGNSILQIVATSGGRSANIKYTSGSLDWYQGHLQASMGGLGGRFVVASYELDNTKPLVYDSNGDVIIGGMAPSARLTVNSRGTTVVNTVFKASALQSANMAEWRASDGVVIAKVAADGSIASSGTVSATNLSVFASGAVGDTDSESLKISSDGTTYDIFSTPTGAGSHRRIDIGGFDGAAYRGLRLDTTNGIFEWQYNNATKFKVDATTCNISSTTTVTNDIRSDNHRPLTDKTYDSGETGYRWANGYFVNGDFNGTLNASGVSMMRIAEADYPSYQEGTFFYDDENHALAIYNDESETIQRLGQEEFLRVRNNTAETIDKGCAVLITGAHGASVPTVSGAIATSEANSQVVGLANHSIESNSFGYVTTFGKIVGVDTSQYSEGDEIYLSSENIGSGVSTSPTVPNYKLSIGHCINSHSNNGSVMVQLGHPKLGGGDTKSVAPVHVSGIPFVSGVADGGSSAVLMYEDGFEYSQGSGLVTKAITASSGTFLSGVSVNSSSPDRSSPLDVYGDPTAVNRVVAQFKSSTGAEVLNIYNGNSDTTPVASLRSTNAYLSIYNGVDIRKTGGSGKMFGVQNPGNETKFRVDTDGEVALGSSASLYTYTNLATLDVIPKSASFPGIAVIGNVSQTANLQEWKASDEVNVATVAPDGSIASSGDISASGNITTNGELLTDLIRGEVYFKNLASNHIIVDASETGTNNAKMTSRGNRFIITAENGFSNNLGYLILNGEGGTYLQYDGADKLSTTSTGVSVDGHFTATSKSFLIDHPTKKDAKLQYASLEGPEHGVYVRGRVTENVIELPDHWVGLVDEESITVQLTATTYPQPNMFVSSIVNNKVYISSDVEIDAFYNVYAERKDVDKLEVEIWQ